MSETLANLLCELNEDEAMAQVQERLAAGDDPLGIIEECREGMEIVGKRFEGKEYFITELIMAGEIFGDIMKKIEPALKGRKAETVGKIVIGTVQGDIHDIGKNIVSTMLGCSGFEVFDLGVDVPPEKFVEKIKEVGAPLVGLSGLMTTSFNTMKETVEAIVKAGLRDKVKVLVGGGPVNERVVEFVRADAFGKDVTTAIELSRNYLGVK
ncbi:MAG: corrinoid protein [Dehalococcoidia bacterium]|nr:corrinoid protein [Dehalococcoidia bacterium]